MSDIYKNSSSEVTTKSNCDNYNEYVTLSPAPLPRLEDVIIDLIVDTMLEIASIRFEVLMTEPNWTASFTYETGTVGVDYYTSTVTFSSIPDSAGGDVNIEDANVLFNYTYTYELVISCVGFTDYTETGSFVTTKEI